MSLLLPPIVQWSIAKRKIVFLFLILCNIKNHQLKNDLLLAFPDCLT